MFNNSEKCIRPSQNHEESYWFINLDPPNRFGTHARKMDATFACDATLFSPIRGYGPPSCCFLLALLCMGKCPSPPKSQFWSVSSGQESRRGEGDAACQLMNLSF